MNPAWDETGAVVTPRADKGKSHAPMHLSHAEIAGLSDYDAFALDLPKLMNAVIAVRIEGRIDVPEFRVSIALEPYNHMHPWQVYQRQGAALFVGERVLRLNRQQFNLFNAFEAMQAAGSDVAARLKAWPQMAEALKLSSDAHVVINGYIPRLKISHVTFPAKAMTRMNGKLRAASANDAWAMDAGYRYYLRADV